MASPVHSAAASSQYSLVGSLNKAWTVLQKTAYEMPSMPCCLFLCCFGGDEYGEIRGLVDRAIQHIEIAQEDSGFQSQCMVAIVECCASVEDIQERLKKTRELDSSLGEVVQKVYRVLEGLMKSHNNLIDLRSRFSTPSRADAASIDSFGGRVSPARSPVSQHFFVPTNPLEASTSGPPQLAHTMRGVDR
jgi:hypothetical protein